MSDIVICEGCGGTGVERHYLGAAKGIRTGTCRRCKGSGRVVQTVKTLRTETPFVPGATD